MSQTRNSKTRLAGRNFKEELFALEKEHGQLLIELDTTKNLNDLLMQDNVSKRKKIEELEFELLSLKSRVK